MCHLMQFEPKRPGEDILNVSHKQLALLFSADPSVYEGFLLPAGGQESAL